MRWCARVCMCVTKSDQGARKVKVQRSGNFNWPYLGQFSTQNQKVLSVLKSAPGPL